MKIKTGLLTCISIQLVFVLVIQQFIQDVVGINTLQIRFRRDAAVKFKAK